MNTASFNNLIIILLCGSLVMLAFIHIANPTRVNRNANYWFGAFLLLWSSFWMEEIALITGFGVLNIYFTEAVHYLQIFVCFFYYLAVAFYINPAYRFQWKDTRHLTIPALYLILRLIQGLYGDEKNILTGWIVVVAICQPILYTIIIFIKIRKHQQNIRLFSSDTTGIDLGWLEYIIIMLLGTSLVFGGYSLLYQASPPNLYINCAQLLAVLFIAYYSLKQKEIYPVDAKQRVELIAFNEEPEPDPKKKIVPDEEVISLKKQLLEIMGQEKLYLDSELNLVKLAERLSVSSHQLSYVLNNGFNENFFQFINKYRVEKAKELLLTGAGSHFSILGIAFESGFNSKTSFNTTFKKFTGQTPSEFRNTRAVL